MTATDTLTAAGYAVTADRQAEGVLVIGNGVTDTRVTMTYDSPSTARFLSVAAENHLILAGFITARDDDFTFYVIS